MVRNFDKPVTCKIRFLDKMEDTIDFVKMVEQTGVKAVAVHARYVDQRPRQPAHLGLVKIISSCLSIPVVANGDAFVHSDISKIKELTGCSSVMIARGAMWNASIFSKDESKREPELVVARKYVDNVRRKMQRFASDWTNFLTDTKQTNKHTKNSASNTETNFHSQNIRF